MFRGVWSGKFAHGAYWALLNDDTGRCGITNHILDPGIDTGPVVAQALISPTAADSFVTYPYLQLGAPLPMLIEQVLRAIAGELVPLRPECKSAVWYHPGVSILRNDFCLPLEASGPLEDFGLGRSGLVLLWKRLEHNAFRWPPISDGVMRLSASQLAALMDGLDWSRLHVRDVAQPTATS